MSSPSSSSSSSSSSLSLSSSSTTMTSPLRNKNSFYLMGDKLKLEVRQCNKNNSTGSKSQNLAKGPARAASVVPLLSLKTVDKSLSPKRPYSANCYVKSDLPSSELLKQMLSEPIQSWRNYYTQNDKENGILNIETTSVISLASGCHIEKAIECGELVPDGLLTKPPLPTVTVLESDATEKIEKSPPLAINREVLLQNWITEEKEIESEILLSERRTDQYFDDLKNNQTTMNNNSMTIMDVESSVSTSVEENGESISIEMQTSNYDIVEDTSRGYDEIMALLRVLEEQDRKSHQKMETIKGIVENEINQTHQVDYSNNISNDFNKFLSFLDEVDLNNTKTLSIAKERLKSSTDLIQQSNIKLDSIPRFEDLIDLSQAELANYIIDLSLRVKDKSSSIILLQKELSTLRENILTNTKQTEFLIKQKLKTQKVDCEETIKRHQKFIDQLIADKKNLNQQCESLITEMKVLEERYTSNVKAIEQRHQIELQKAKEMCIAGEKIRRERWIDSKTQIIKEMTVKSLEPELEAMAIRHQQELTDLRNIHKHEIEELELKAARKTQQQCELLRQQLMVEREQAIKHERELSHQRYETEVKSLQEQRRRLLNEHAARIAECEQREAIAIAEKEKFTKQVQEEYEEKLQLINRRHSNEIKIIKETMELEMEAWQNNYKKQQMIHLTEKEMAIKTQCRKERDREIEKVIERLEIEATEIKKQMEESVENRVKRLNDKFQCELKDLERSENDAKNKYLEVKNKLLENEDIILTLKANIKQLQFQLNENKDVTEKLIREKEKVKESVREELNAEFAAMEKELNDLKMHRDKELQTVYARVKMAIARKDEMLEEMSRDQKALQEKCIYLENILEQQRKEMVIMNK